MLQEAFITDLSDYFYLCAVQVPDKAHLLPSRRPETHATPSAMVQSLLRALVPISGHEASSVFDSPADVLIATVELSAAIELK